MADPAVQAYLDALYKQKQQQQQPPLIPQPVAPQDPHQQAIQDPAVAAYLESLYQQQQNPAPKEQEVKKTDGSLRFNSEAEASLRNLDEQEANLRSGSNNALARIQQMLSSNQQMMDRNRGTDQGLSKERLASQGILRSGIAIDQQSKIGQQYADQTTQMNSQAAQQQEDTQRDLAGQLRGISSGRDQVRTEQARQQDQLQRETDMKNAQAQAQQKALQDAQPKPNPQGQYQDPHQQAIQDPAVARYLEALYQQRGGQ